MFLTRRPVYWLLILILISQLGARAQDRPPSDQDEPIRLKTDLVTVTAMPKRVLFIRSSLPPKARTQNSVRFCVPSRAS